MVRNHPHHATIRNTDEPIPVTDDDGNLDHERIAHDRIYNRAAYYGTLAVFGLLWLNVIRRVLR